MPATLLRCGSNSSVFSRGIAKSIEKSIDNCTKNHSSYSLLILKSSWLGMPRKTRSARLHHYHPIVKRVRGTRPIPKSDQIYCSTLPFVLSLPSFRLRHLRDVVRRVLHTHRRICKATL